MNEITICDTLIGIKEYKGQRVVTFKDIEAVHGIRTYSIVYGTMGTKASWSQLMRRCGARTKKEVILARPDKYELFCECIEKLMNEI